MPMTVSTLNIGAKLSIENTSIIKLIRSYEYLFKRIAPVKFLTMNRKGRPTIYCELTDKQIMLLLGLMRNSNKKVIDQKFSLAYFGSLNEDLWTTT